MACGACSVRTTGARDQSGSMAVMRASKTVTPRHRHPDSCDANFHYDVARGVL
jgi:hypothetical protein